MRIDVLDNLKYVERSFKHRPCFYHLTDGMEDREDGRSSVVKLKTTDSTVCLYRRQLATIVLRLRLTNIFNQYMKVFEQKCRHQHRDKQPCHSANNTPSTSFGHRLHIIDIPAPCLINCNTSQSHETPGISLINLMQM
ncbi:MAG: hypothetical protein SOZ80_01975 [Prevotella sp.]|uniref:hypothetical protein n=1 Tax=Prevotella sp. TaxID=59823 RepID=UPI002A2C3582|nr:hypothetical protein [Prevotella sp.]MDD7317438.1 hypothetical protein [Prevotellaceae bacterium]MDY4019536.1 hypothetical protein [Prevotella sp.]